MNDNNTTDYFIRANEIKPMLNDLKDIKLILDKMSPDNGNAHSFNAELYSAVYVSLFNLIQKMERKLRVN